MAGSYQEQTGTRSDNSAVDSAKVLSELSRGKFAINSSVSSYMPEKYTLTYINSLFTAKDQIEEFWNNCVALASEYIDKFENAPYPETIAPNTSFLGGIQLGENEQLGYIISDTANLYSKPNGEVVGALTAGAQVVATSRTSDGNWIEVRTSDGQTAYVPTNSIGNKKDVPKTSTTTTGSTQTVTTPTQVTPGAGLTDGKYEGMNYYAYEPSQDGTPKSLTVFLYGRDEGGNDITKLTKYGLGKNLKNQQDYDGNILLVQGWDTDKINSLIDKYASENNIDPNKISIAGYSKGASAAAELIRQNPNKFSAAAFIGSSVNDSEYIDSLSSIPTKFISGSRDSATDKSASMSAKLSNAGGSSSTYVYQGKGHENSIVTAAYDDGLYKWLTSQSRAKTT